MPFANLMQQMNQDKYNGSGPTLTLGKNASTFGYNIYITGQELSIVDIAMQNEIYNVLGMLRLDDQATRLGSGGKGEPDIIDYKEVIQVKYPCVAQWMKSLESLAQVRRYQVKFEKQYIEKFWLNLKA